MHTMVTNVVQWKLLIRDTFVQAPLSLIKRLSCFFIMTLKTSWYNILIQSALFYVVRGYLVHQHAVSMCGMVATSALEKNLYVF